MGGRWYTFDATQAELKDGYVAVGYGRDTADVAIYNQFGPPVFPVCAGRECGTHAALADAARGPALAETAPA